MVMEDLTEEVDAMTKPISFHFLMQFFKKKTRWNFSVTPKCNMDSLTTNSFNRINTCVQLYTSARQICIIFESFIAGKPCFFFNSITWCLRLVLSGLSQIVPSTRTTKETVSRFQSTKERLKPIINQQVTWNRKLVYAEFTARISGFSLWRLAQITSVHIYSVLSKHV